MEVIEARLLRAKECELLEGSKPLSFFQAQNANSFVKNVFLVSVGFSFMWVMYVCSVSQGQWNLNYFGLK